MTNSNNKNIWELNPLLNDDYIAAILKSDNSGWYLTASASMLEECVRCVTDTLSCKVKIFYS